LRALEQREIPFANDEPLRLECQAFLSAMETRVPPLTDGRSGLRLLKVLQAAQRSLVMDAGRAGPAAGVDEPSRASFAQPRQRWYNSLSRERLALPRGGARGATLSGLARG